MASVSGMDVETLASVDAATSVSAVRCVCGVKRLFVLMRQSAGKLSGFSMFDGEDLSSTTHSNALTKTSSNTSLFRFSHCSPPDSMNLRMADLRLHTVQSVIVRPGSGSRLTVWAADVETRSDMSDSHVNKSNSSVNTDVQQLAGSPRSLSHFSPLAC